MEKMFAVEAVKGFWIIFSPFLLGVLWAAWLRGKSRQCQREEIEVDKTNESSGETKKTK